MTDRGKTYTVNPALEAPRQGLSMNNPLPTLEWTHDSPKPPSWWGRNPQGELTKVYLSYEDYCDD